MEGSYILAGHTESYGAGGSDFWLVFASDCIGQTPIAPQIVACRENENIRLSWSPVTHSADGCSVDVTGYRAYYSRIAGQPDYYLGFTADTSILHETPFTDDNQLFYLVKAVSEE